MTYNKEEKMNGLEALNDLKNCLQAYYTMENVPKIDSNIATIEEDLEILYMLRKNMHIDTETIKDDDNKIEEYEYIAYNYWELDIENKEEYIKLREWLLK